MATKKRNKKYIPKLNDEHIPFIERSTSLIIKYINEFAIKLNGELTTYNIINHLLMAHRFTFMDELEYLEVRWGAENIFIELDKLLKDNPSLPQGYIFNISETVRDLILSFLKELKSKLFNITKRSEYAKLFKEMIVSHNIYCYDKPYINMWLNRDEIADSLLCCRKRIEMPSIRKAKIQGKIAFINQGKDIEYMELI